MANTELVQCDETCRLTITVEEYKSLIETSLRGNMLADAILGATYLGYDGRLSITSDRFDVLLRAIDPRGYNMRLRELRAEEAKE